MSLAAAGSTLALAHGGRDRTVAEQSWNENTLELFKMSCCMRNASVRNWQSIVVVIFHWWFIHMVEPSSPCVFSWCRLPQDAGMLPQLRCRALNSNFLRPQGRVTRIHTNQFQPVKPDPHLVLSGFCLVPGYCVLALPSPGWDNQADQRHEKEDRLGGRLAPCLGNKYLGSPSTWPWLVSDDHKKQICIWRPTPQNDFVSNFCLHFFRLHFRVAQHGPTGNGCPWLLGQWCVSANWNRPDKHHWAAGWSLPPATQDWQGSCGWRHPATCSHQLARHRASEWPPWSLPLWADSFLKKPYVRDCGEGDREWCLNWPMMGEQGQNRTDRRRART